MFGSNFYSYTLFTVCIILQKYLHIFYKNGFDKIVKICYDYQVGSGKLL